MAICLAATTFVLLSATVQASTFLGSHPTVEMQSMPTQELELLLLSELKSFETDARLSAAATELKPLYAALPKNQGGNLDPTVVRYALHRFFARKYGWHLRGLEPRGGAWNTSSPSTIMKDKAPSYIMDVFEQRLHGHGFGLKELAVFAVTLSDLIHREAISDLQDIFFAMGNEWSSHLTDGEMARLIKTYLMTYLTGVHSPKNSSADYAEMEDTMESDIIVWFDAKMWVQDMRRSFLFSQRMRRNPFRTEHTLAEAAEVAMELGHHFGTFQNMECKSLKEKLVDMEHGGSGRVGLAKFYSGVGVLDWPFFERVDYLRNLGALDESDARHPSVIIPNFLGSPSNCEAPSNFYSVCCIDECEGLLAQVEAVVAGPAASPSQLARIISNLESDTVAAPRNLSSVQLSRLGEIADRHGGSVPLHGRLFSQWMHHAYPRECRYPHVAGSTNPLSRDEFTSKFGLDHEVTDEELAKFTENSTASEPATVSLPWTMAEELIAPHQGELRAAPTASAGWTALRIFALVALALSAGLSFAGSKCFEPSSDKQERHLV